MNWVDSNIYWFAEDRVKMEKIVRLDSYSSLNRYCSGHTLKFHSASKGYIEGQKTLFGLLIQRRRWISGSWLALMKSIFESNNVKEIFYTKHTIFRKISLLLQFWYYILLISFQWCSIGAYYSAFSLALRVIF